MPSSGSILTSGCDLCLLPFRIPVGADPAAPPEALKYSNVPVFVTLTAPQAVRYAIPTERFMAIQAAQSVNAWFLEIVAVWRVALLGWFLRRFAQLFGPSIVVAALFPLVAIVVVLTSLNLEHVVFEIMAAVDPEDQTGSDLADFVVTTIAVLSVILVPFLIAG